MIGGGCWEAFRAGAYPGHSLGFAACSSGRPWLVGRPWAHLGAYYIRPGCAGSGACQDGRLVEEDAALPTLRGIQGLRGRRRCRQQNWVQGR